MTILIQNQNSVNSVFPKFKNYCIGKYNGNGEDVSQSVISSLLSKIQQGKFTHRTSQETLSYCIFRAKDCHDKLVVGKKGSKKREAIFCPFDSIAPLEAPMDSNPEQSASRRETLNILKKYLPPKHQKIINELIEGYTLSDISAKRNWTGDKLRWEVKQLKKSISQILPDTIFDAGEREIEDFKDLPLFAI